MAPSVLQLEISRLGRLLDQLRIDDDRRNVLVSARYRLGLLKEIVTGDFETADLEVCDEHLRTAILSLGFRPDAADRVAVAGTTAAAGAGLETIPDNIADRLGYVRERLRRLR
ncbi:MAG: hypothetical protein ACI9W4_000661 [Rhodothermales bacterium]|jgi:hypothetical protein